MFVHYELIFSVFLKNKKIQKIQSARYGEVHDRGLSVGTPSTRHVRSVARLICTPPTKIKTTRRRIFDHHCMDILNPTHSSDELITSEILGGCKRTLSFDMIKSEAGTC